MDGPVSEYDEFLKSYWADMADRGTKKEFVPVICNWIHYVIGDEDSALKGFGGSRFEIKYIDGRIAHTTNLWHQGTIPEDFRHLFTNNASSVKMM